MSHVVLWGLLCLYAYIRYSLRPRLADGMCVPLVFAGLACRHHCEHMVLQVVQ